MRIPSSLLAICDNPSLFSGLLSSSLHRQFELRTAIELGKKIVLVHETEGAHGKFDFASEKAATPEDIRAVLDGA